MWHAHQKFNEQAGEVMAEESAFGHLTLAVNEVVNLAPFVTSFSIGLMAL